MTIKQTVVQYNQNNVPVRMIVQYETENGDNNQVIVERDELSASEQTTYDEFKALSESKMQ
jgi:hypothetical protein